MHLIPGQAELLDVIEEDQTYVSHIILPPLLN